MFEAIFVIFSVVFIVGLFVAGVISVLTLF